MGQSLNYPINYFLHSLISLNTEIALFSCPRAYILQLFLNNEYKNFQKIKINTKANKAINLM